MMEQANSNATSQAPATETMAADNKPVAIMPTPEQMAKIAEVTDDIKALRTQLRDKEIELATLEREAGITRVSKIKSAVMTTAKSTSDTLVSVGATIKQGSLKLANKTASAFKSKEITDSPPSESEPSTAASFGTKFSAARDRFTASFKRATTKTTAGDTQAATEAVEPVPSSETEEVKSTKITLEDNVDDDDKEEAAEGQ